MAAAHPHNDSDEDSLSLMSSDDEGEDDNAYSNMHAYSRGDNAAGASGVASSIRNEPLKQKQTPEDIECPVEPMDISFHPTMDYLASGLINGQIMLHQYMIPNSTATAGGASAAASSATTTGTGHDGQAIYNHGKPETSVRCVEFDRSGQSKVPFFVSILNK